MLVGVCVHRRGSIERYPKNMGFGRERGCGGPYLAAPPTSALVQNRVEFGELVLSAYIRTAAAVIPGFSLKGTKCYVSVTWEHI